MKDRGKESFLKNNKQKQDRFRKHNKLGEGYFTVDELAERWRLHRNTIRNYINKNLLTIFKPPGGRIILIPVDEISKYEQHQIQNRREIDRYVSKNRKALTARNEERRAE